MSNVVNMAPQPCDPPPQGSKFITLAGKQWPIPRLALKQWRIVMPNIFKLFGELGPMFESAMKARSATTAPEVLIKQFNLTSAQIDLLGDTVLVSLHRAHKGITVDQFQDMEISLEELLAAIPIIMEQTGLFDSKKGAPPVVGEATAGSLTGTV
jgi:hypothetical protein